jgi:hypothetical protein
MSCQPTCSRSFGGIAYTQSAQGKSNQKVLGSVQREQGLLTLLLPGNHHSSDSCNVILVSFLTAQLKKYLGFFPTQEHRAPQNLRRRSSCSEADRREIIVRFIGPAGQRHSSAHRDRSSGQVAEQQRCRTCFSA